MATNTLLSRNLIYSWWVHPIATKQGDDICFGGITDAGAIRLFDRAPGTNVDTPIANQIIDTLPEADDHNGVARIQATGEDRWAFFCRHNASTNLNHMRSGEGELDYDSLDAETLPSNTTYAQILHYGTSKLIVLTRSNTKQWRFVLSEDWGATWDSPVQLLDGGSLSTQLYLTTTPSEDEANVYHLAIAPNPTEATWRQIGYAKLDVSTGDISVASGVIANIYSGSGLPLDKEDFDLLDPTQASNQRCRLLDVGDKYGQTIIYYAKWSPSQSPTYYQAVQNTDGSWTRTNLSILAPVFAYAGDTDPNYVGGISIDKNGSNCLYMSQKGTGGTWSINRYPINSNFTLGTREIVVTNGTYPLVRPYAVYGGNSCIYQELRDYDSYVDYLAYIYLLEF